MIGLSLKGLEVDCIIGDLPEERVKAQRLEIDIVLEIDSVANATDSLGDTVDYAALSSKIRAALVEARCRMIERAAQIALDVCMACERVSSATVEVTKKGAVAGLRSAAACVSARKKGA